MPTQPHRSLTLSGPAGRIEAILWSIRQVGGAAPPMLAAVVCHPHPLFGGTMHNKVVYQAAKTIHRFGLPVARFNFRGVGLSEGNARKITRARRGGRRSGRDRFPRRGISGRAAARRGLQFWFLGRLRAPGAATRASRNCSASACRSPILGPPRAFPISIAAKSPSFLVTGEFDRFGPPQKIARDGRAVSGRASSKAPRS